MVFYSLEVTIQILQITEISILSTLVPADLSTTMAIDDRYSLADRLVPVL